MNKLFIGLLIIAAGTGAFFLLRKKNNQVNSKDIRKEWILGEWRVDSYRPAKDSTQPHDQYHFLESGLVLHSLNDSARADTSHYEWSRNNELVVKENAADSTGQVFSFLKLSTDSLQLQRADSSTVLFIKLK